MDSGVVKKPDQPDSCQIIRQIRRTAYVPPCEELWQRVEPPHVQPELLDELGLKDEHAFSKVLFTGDGFVVALDSRSPRLYSYRTVGS